MTRTLVRRGRIKAKADAPAPVITAQEPPPPRSQFATELREFKSRIELEVRRERAAEMETARRKAEGDPALLRAHNEVERLLGMLIQAAPVPTPEFHEEIEVMATATKEPKAKKVKAAKAPKAEKKMSALDAAAKVLAGAKEPKSVGELIEAMEKRGLWASPGGKTPGATLSAAIGKEIATKGKESRFKKVGPGAFAAN